MNTVRMILCGNVEDSRMNPSEKVGVVSVVFVSTEEEKIKNKLKKLQDKNPEKFYMEYVTPLDVDLTSLEHYPSMLASAQTIHRLKYQKMIYNNNFAFVERNGTMKAPVGLLSDRAVLRSKMEGPRPDKFAFIKVNI